MERNKTNKIDKVRRIGISICLVVLTILMAMASYFTVTAGGTYELSDDNQADYSFYMLSSCLATTLTMCIADPNGEDMVDALSTVNANSAGCFLGYDDQSVAKGIKGLFTSFISTSSCTYNYSQLCSESFQHVGEGSGSSFVFSQYCMLGAGLADIGIDKTGTDGSTSLGRSISGWVVLAVYRLAMAVNGFLKIVIDVMKWLNPFQFFSKANEKASAAGITMGVDHSGLANTDTAAGALMNPLTEVISELYAKLYDFSSIVLLILFSMMAAMLFVNVFLSKQTDSRMGIIKKYLFRAGFIVFGIPLLGGTYTVILDKMSQDIQSGNTAAAKIVASTFVDFESWVMNSSMILPDTVIMVDTNKGHITASAGNSIQDICYAFNEKATSGLPARFTSGSAANDVSKLIGQIQNETRSSAGNLGSTDEWVVSLLQRYQSGKKIYASEYEQSWISKFWLKDNDADFNEKRENYVKNFATPQVLLQVDGSERATFWNSEVPSGYIRGPIGRDANGTGSSAINGINLNNKNTGSQVSNSLKLPALAVYNYLNSTFNETTVRVYSSEKASSGHIRDYHYSVNLVGKGEQSFVYLLLCITMLFTYSVLGFVYAFGIIMSNIKRGIRLIVAVPGAMLGSLASVAKVISYTVLMIAELVLNIMLYMLTTDLIFSVASVITTTFVSTAAGVFSSTFVSSGAFSTLVSILVIIFLIWFTVQAIKLRNPIIRSLEEMADNVVNKFITGQTAGGAAQGSGSQGECGTAKGAQIAAMEPKRRFRTPIGRACEKMGDTSKQEAFLGQMFGGNGSAFKEDQAFRQRDLEKRAAKKHARREMLEAGKQLAVGAGEFAAGAASGNAALMAQGAKNTLHGIGTANQAAENKHQADKNADTKLAMTLNPDIAKHDERLGYTKGQSKDIERMPLGSEMAQAAQLSKASNIGGTMPESGSVNGSTDLRSNAAYTGADSNKERVLSPGQNSADNPERVFSGSADGGRAAATLKAVSSDNGSNPKSNTVAECEYMDNNMEASTDPAQNMDDVPGKNKNVRRQARSIERVSVDSSTGQEVQINGTDRNQTVSQSSLVSSDSSINLNTEHSFATGQNIDNNPEDNQDVRKQTGSTRRVSIDNKTDQEVRTNSVDGNGAVSTINKGSDTSNINPKQTDHSSAAGNFVNIDPVEDKGQRINSSRKTTKKSVSLERDEEIYIQSAKKAAGHVREKQEIANEYNDGVFRSDGYESHDFVEQKLSTHADLTEERTKKRKMQHGSVGSSLGRRNEKFDKLPKNKKQDRKKTQD